LQLSRPETGHDFAISPSNTPGGAMSQFQGILHKDLKKFGLNPSEWTIEQLEERLFQIAHIEDKQFYFLGEAQLEGLIPEWTHLHLFSL